MDEYRLSDDPVPQELLDIQNQLSEWNQHKVYFDNETGEIFAIANEDLDDYNFFFTIPSDKIDILKNEKLEDYRVVFDAEGNPSIALKPKKDEESLFLIKLVDVVFDDTEFVVEKNLQSKQWILSLNEDKRMHFLKTGVNASIELFIVEKDNRNFLIQKITLSLKSLCDNNPSYFPFVSYREESNNIEVYSKKFFTSQGLKIKHVK